MIALRRLVAGHHIKALAHLSADALLFTCDAARSAQRLLSRDRLAIADADATGSLCLLGNGPSLASELPTLARDDRRLAVNTLASVEYYVNVRPSYYVLADVAFWDLERHPGSRDKATRLWRDLHDRTTWPLTVFLPSTARTFEGVFSHITRNPNIGVRYFNATRNLSSFGGAIGALYRKNLVMPKAQNVLIAALYVGINLGYKSIRLYGADHDWITNLAVDSQGRVCLKDVHFNTTTGEPYRPWVDITGKQYRMHEIMDVMSAVFRAYDDLRQYAEMNRVQVVNHTAASLIDAFPKHTSC